MGIGGHTVHGHTPSRFLLSLQRATDSAKLPPVAPRVHRCRRRVAHEHLRRWGLVEPAVQPYWKDETMVSILSSDEASRFMQNHEDSLLANGKRQLDRLIHLLRIACKKPNPLWTGSEEVQGAALAICTSFQME